MAYIVINGRLERIHRNRWNGKTNAAQIIGSRINEKAKAALKGIKDGNCNITACQKPGATWWNISTRAYYCAYCASEINRWSKYDDGVEICFSNREDGEAAQGDIWKALREKQVA